MTITKDSPAARGFLEFVKTPIAHEILMSGGNFLTAHKYVNKAAFANKTQAKLNEILTNASTFRFDASDLMPAAVGQGTFWQGMVDYIGGKDAAAVASDIDKGWDAVE